MARYKFGEWTVDTEALVVAHDSVDYPIPLNRLLDSAEILDFLAQVDMKTWATAHTIRNLLKAIDYCVHLQANVCGSGVGKRITMAVVEKNLKLSPRS